MITGPAKEDALHEYVEGVRRLAAQHKPRASLRRHLYDLRHAQLRRVVAKMRLDAKEDTDGFLRPWWGMLSERLKRMTGSVCICAVDCGLTGAISFYFPSHPDKVSVVDMPVVGGEVDADAFAQKIWQMAPDFAVVERVGPMPKQGVSSVWKFAGTYYTARAVLAACKVPTHLVAPTVWKRYYRIAADKEQARGLAIRLWPGLGHFERRQDHNRAEACLLARYGAEVVLVDRAVAQIQHEVAA